MEWKIMDKPCITYPCLHSTVIGISSLTLGLDALALTVPSELWASSSLQLSAWELPLPVGVRSVC